MGRGIVILLCVVVAVSGQSDQRYQVFLNRARDNLLKYSHRVLNRSLKIEDLAPVVNGIQKAVQQSTLLQTPIFHYVNATGTGGTASTIISKQTVKRESFLADDKNENDVTPYQSDFFRGCTTPGGQNGKCSDLTACPVLLLDLTNLRKSICFQSLFVPGVCCPTTDQVVPERSTRRPTTSTTTTTTTTTTRPFIADLLNLFTTRQPSPITAAPAVVIQAPPRPQFVSPSVSSNEIVLSDNTGQSFKKKDVCGKVTIASLRIVGGEVATVGEWPWMAAIYLTGPNGREYWCGGSLITRKHVLTAAHCTQDGKQKRFDASQFSVELGRTNLISGDKTHMQSFKVTEVRVHPNFRAHGFYNDVSIFTLDDSATYDDYVRPACLPSAEDDSFSLVGELPTVIGFGATDYGGRESNILREVQIPVWRNEDCDRAYIQPITEIFVCAGYADGGKDACQGDSGGPLQLYKNGNWVQIGLVSFGNKCAEPGYPGVYTRITKFARWIEANSLV